MEKMEQMRKKVNDACWLHARGSDGMENTLANMVVRCFIRWPYGMSLAASEPFRNR